MLEKETKITTLTFHMLVNEYEAMFKTKLVRLNSEIFFNVHSENGILELRSGDNHANSPLPNHLPNTKPPGIARDKICIHSQRNALH